MKDKSTAALCELVSATRWADLPDSARQSARRAVYNWFGLVLHAANHPPVRIVREYVQTLGGSGATAVGGLATAPVWAALVNATASHVEDFDDTHHATIIHPTAPVWSAVLAVGEERRLGGAEALTAFVLGTEVAMRVGLAVYPSHYDRGHHITATAGTLGAAAAVAKLLGLKPAEIGEALGLASTEAAGLKGTFGSMAKALHPGQAALRGIMAAELAKRQFTSGNTGLESKLGFCHVLSDKVEPGFISDRLGKHWLINDNAIKPYSCGVVAHAAIDGILRLRQKGLQAKQVKAISLKVHPRVAELTGNPKPKLGLEGKFSVQHSVAAALIDGRAGPRQYTDARVQAAEVIALRDVVTLKVDPELRLDEAHVSVTLAGGGQETVHVQHSVGSPDYPMSDEQLDDKVQDLLRDAKVDGPKLRAQVYGLDNTADLGTLARQFLGPK